LVLFAQFQNDQKPARPHPAKNNLLRDRLAAGWMVTQYHHSMSRTNKMAGGHYISDFKAFIELKDSLESAVDVYKSTLIKKQEYEAIIQRKNEEIINLNKELEDSKTYVAELKAKHLREIDEAINDNGFARLAAFRAEIEMKHYKNVASWYQSRMSTIKSAADDNGAAKIEADEDVLNADEPPAFPDSKRRRKAEDSDDICCDECGVQIGVQMKVIANDSIVTE